MKSSIRILAGLGLALAAWPAAAQCPADTTTTTPDDFTCYVATTGSNANSGTRSSPMRDIQFALDVAALGAEFQTVRVFPGTYVECPFAGGGGVPGNVDIVADAFLTTANNATTIIDGTTVCTPAVLPVVVLGDNSKLRGFTIKGGGDGGVVAFGHVTVSNNVIENNATALTGGGIYLETGASVGGDAAQARIENNTVRNNQADLDGGGIYVLATGDGLPSSVVVNKNTVQNNKAGLANTGLPQVPVPMYGGGIAVFTDSFLAGDESDVAITSNTIEGNEVRGFDLYSASYGGGLAVATYGAAKETIAVTTTNVVRNNKAINGYGGGISALGQSFLASGTIDHDVLVESSSVSTNNATYGGGGIYALALTLQGTGTDKEVVRVLSNDVAGNVTDASSDFGVTGGGGIYAEFFNEQTGSSVNSLTVALNSLRNNSSESLGGGAALYVRSYGEPDGALEPLPATSRLRFANNLVTGNAALDTKTDPSDADGGGVYALALGQGGGTAAVDLKFNTLANNATDVGFSGGIALDGFGFAGPTSPAGTASLDASNSIFVNNDGFEVGGTASPGVDNTTVRIAYNDAFDVGPGPYAAQYLPILGPGNLEVDPELDAFFFPLLCSPTIDAGDPAEGTFLGQGGLQEERQPNGRRANLGHTGLTLNATITLPDATGDALVDGADVLRLATSFASISTDAARYNASADLDRDGDIDGNDLAYMAASFGKACP